MEISQLIHVQVFSLYVFHKFNHIFQKDKTMNPRTLLLFTVLFSEILSEMN